MPTHPDHPPARQPRDTGQAAADAVTGLPSRSALQHQMAGWMGRLLPDNGGGALLMIDVPCIAEIRIGMGFDAGDALARAVAGRLRAAGGAHAEFGQLGDTAFGLLLDTAPADAAAAADALLHRALAVQQALQVPVQLGNTEIVPLCAIGIGRWPLDGDQPPALLEAAQAARYDTAPGAAPAFFRPETKARALRAMQIEAALRQALQTGEFELHYQPKVDLGSGAVIGAEALLRWQSATLGNVLPAEIIPIADRAGLSAAIGEWVARRACEQAVAWRSAGVPAVRIGVNLTMAQLQRPDFAQHLQAILNDTGADPTCLGVEITEDMLLTDLAQAAAVLRGLRAIGIEISLDDFGTGHSSLKALSRLPIDVVKVDRSLVQDVTAATQQVSVTRAIINMAHGLQMKVLAEGVETEGQLALLASNGCDQMQGYCYSPALPADAFAALVLAPKRLPERFLLRSRQQRTLLLVDDEDNILSALKRLLRRDGYRIVTATSAAEGLLRLAEHQVDVIMSDQRMPGMTGVDFLHRAKALYPDTVRLVLSGYTDLQSIIGAVNEGAIYKFLTKPWDDDRLRAHVAEAFRQKDLADDNRRLALQVETANADLADLNARLERLLACQRDHTALLAANAEHTRDLLDNLPAAVLGVDPDGLVAYANLMADSTLADAGGLLGRPLDEVLPDFDPAAAGTRAMDLAGRPHLVRGHPLDAGSTSRGQLLILLHQPNPIDR